MAALRNPRHEKFAQGLVEGLSIAEAWRRAGFKGDRKRASKGGRREDVRGRAPGLLLARRRLM